MYREETMLDVVILAGGKGYRLGALGLSKQKGALRFKGIPILTHVIKSILPLDAFNTIWVATGYRGKDVQETLEEHHTDLLLNGRIITVDAPHIHGELSRFAYVIGHIPESRDCIVTGVDTILPATVFTRLEKRSQEIEQKTILMAVSPRKHIAPTHRLVTLSGDVIRTYEHPERVPIHERHKRFIDVGTRYFAACVLDEIRNAIIPDDTDPDDFLRERIGDEKNSVRAIVFREYWRHFAFVSDFLK